MSHKEEIAFLDEVRAAANQRLKECSREVALSEDLEGRGTATDEVSRRNRKLRARADRYRILVRRISYEAGEVRRERLSALAEDDRPALVALARKLHRRSRKLRTAMERTQEQYRGLQMRHLALTREARELALALDVDHEEIEEPHELRLGLGDFRTPGED